MYPEADVVFAGADVAAAAGGGAAAPLAAQPGGGRRRPAVSRDASSVRSSSRTRGGCRRAPSAEHVLAVTLALFRRLPHAFRSQTAGEWAQDAMGAEGNRLIAGARVLVVGLGAIGGAVAHRMTLLGAHVDWPPPPRDRRDPRRVDRCTERSPARPPAGGRRRGDRRAAHARDARPHRPARAGADVARRDPRQREPRTARRRSRPSSTRCARARSAAPPSTSSSTSRCRPTARSGRSRTSSSRRTRPASARTTGMPRRRSSPRTSSASTRVSRSSMWSTRWRGTRL